MLTIIIGLLLTGEHYVFYFQERIGYRNRSFKMWKFATMLKNSPNLREGCTLQGMIRECCLWADS